MNFLQTFFFYIFWYINKIQWMHWRNFKEIYLERKGTVSLLFQDQNISQNKTKLKIFTKRFETWSLIVFLSNVTTLSLTFGDYLLHAWKYQYCVKIIFWDHFKPRIVSTYTMLYSFIVRSFLVLSALQALWPSNIWALRII